ncbi:hypothetical protein SLS60_011795 [Paraconiothyrium brasiliense]|uniref:Uncharacterized protein n=1 Tax=Paraconiothyrium brasiliense TaxID=300254 RepID=A0ABR3QHB4_9PLEO
MGIHLMLSLATDDVRLYGRANKGHYTNNLDALNEVVVVKPKSPMPKTDKKSKGANAAPVENTEEKPSLLRGVGDYHAQSGIEDVKRNFVIKECCETQY